MQKVRIEEKRLGRDKDLIVVVEKRRDGGVWLRKVNDVNMRLLSE